MHVRNSLKSAFLALACMPTAALAGDYRIPWRDIPANRCAVLVGPANDGGKVLILRCAGHIDVLLTHCSADRCAP